MNHLRRTEQPWLRVVDVAKLLGVSRTTIDRIISAGELPAVRMGIGRGVRLIARGEVDNFLEQRQSKALAEAEVRRGA